MFRVQVLLGQMQNVTVTLNSRVGLLERAMSTRQNTSSPNMQEVVSKAVSSVVRSFIYSCFDKIQQLRRNSVSNSVEITQ